MDRWIAVDWGTSNLRAWDMDGRQPREERVSDEGMGKLAPGSKVAIKEAPPVKDGDTARRVDAKGGTVP